MIQYSYEITICLIFVFILLQKVSQSDTRGQCQEKTVCIKIYILKVEDQDAQMMLISLHLSHAPSL